MISLFNTGFVRMDLWVFISLVFKCGITCFNLYFIVHLFILRKKELYYIFKTYAGYCIIAVYVFYAFPRMSWELADLITETRAFLLWIFNFFSTLFPFFLYLFFWREKTQLAWGVETGKAIKAAKKKKNRNVQSRKKLTTILVENLHVILQAIIIVILLQHFLFQLYVIPTESMVPAILTGDRPFVTKLQSGPVIPLTDWRLPALIKPGRGNIVVFENPYYTQDSLFKKVFHHFVFLATLSLVNIDRDEYGAVRKQFIVKRIIGVPGDKLKMIDDVVFIKRGAGGQFRPLKEDRDEYSHINLYNESPEIVKQIQDVLITRQTRALLDRWDRKKNEISVSVLKRDITETVTFTRDKLKTHKLSEEEQEKLFYQCQQQTTIVKHIMKSPEFDLYFQNDIQKTNKLIYLDSLEKKNEMGVFYKYFVNQDNLQEEDLSSLSDYEMNGKKLNLIYDHLMLKKFSRYCEIMFNRTDNSDPDSDNQLLSINRDISEFYIYIHYYDFRNFPEFPAGKGNYIPEGSYFLMGDNRYNSLDFRYSQVRYYFRKLDLNDPSSFVYPSSLDPFLLKEEKILGIVAIRLWPLHRFGFIR